MTAPRGHFFGRPAARSEEEKAWADTIGRLLLDQPDLVGHILRGEMSADAAAVQAGFRKPMVSIPVEPEAAARELRRHFEPDELKRLVELLSTAT